MECSRSLRTKSPPLLHVICITWPIARSERGSHRRFRRRRQSTATIYQESVKRGSHLQTRKKRKEASLSSSPKKLPFSAVRSYTLLVRSPREVSAPPSCCLSRVSSIPFFQLRQLQIQ
ncbi:hypothetical protein L2E82_44489 [Cichorium intybus]|uniref:Uncharacterized protein n=1 Tax=Cichorium intybus TaxID=13427 RepID=A0ACB8ZQN7_CICIN|nr:hypothetical protein L2E82_44489 [Cichorium intybus]